MTSLGGANRYFYCNWMWTLREALDWLAGGPGFTRGRRDPVDVRLGDSIDYWTVIGVEPERRLTLHFGLKAPGSGILEFELEPLPDGGTRAHRDRVLAPAGRLGPAVLGGAGAVPPVHLQGHDAGDGAPGGSAGAGAGIGSAPAACNGV